MTRIRIAGGSRFRHAILQLEFTLTSVDLIVVRVTRARVNCRSLRGTVPGKLIIASVRTNQRSLNNCWSDQQAGHLGFTVEVLHAPLVYYWCAVKVNATIHMQTVYLIHCK